MESLKEFYTLLTEDTTASTYFEGVIVDCWNLRNLSEDQFKKKILQQANTKKFLTSVDKQWTAVYPYIRPNQNRDKKASRISNNLSGFSPNSVNKKLNLVVRLDLQVSLILECLRFGKKKQVRAKIHLKLI